MEKQQHADGDIVAVVGAPGSGKTLAIADSLTYEVESGRRVIMLDLTGDLCRYLRPLSALRVSTFDEAKRAFAPRILAFVERDGVPIASTVDDAVTWFCKYHKPGDVFVCDEAEFVFPNQPLKDNPLRMVKLARNWGVRLIVASQRPQGTSTLLRSNATHVAVFRADSGAFIDGCREFGDPELFARARSLPKFHYLYRPRYHEGALAVVNSRGEIAPWLDAD